MHTAFKLPLNLTKDTDLFIWDELPMSPKHALHAVELKLKELMNSNHLFGGKIFVFGGDFRQLMPVIEDSIDSEIFDCCVKSSPLWHNFKIFKLTENMRTGKNEIEFSKWLLDLGDGKLNDSDDFVYLPSECKSTKDSLANIVYGKLIAENNYSDFGKSCICAFYNHDVEEINNEVLNLIPTSSKVYKAINTSDKSILTSFPELLDMIETNGLPPNILNLKNNCVVMLIRNLHIKKGQVNGTRIQLNSLEKNVLRGTIITGTHAGETIFIPRITLIEEKNLSCSIHRHQFPIKLAMALTVHKIQSQTIKNLGIDLRSKAFAHGHIYTAFSRATSFNNIIVRLAENNFEKRFYNKIIYDVLE